MWWHDLPKQAASSWCRPRSRSHEVAHLLQTQVEVWLADCGIKSVAPDVGNTAVDAFVAGKRVQFKVACVMRGQRYLHANLSKSGGRVAGGGGRRTVAPYDVDDPIDLFIIIVPRNADRTIASGVFVFPST